MEADEEKIRKEEKNRAVKWKEGEKNLGKTMVRKRSLSNVPSLSCAIFFSVLFVFLRSLLPPYSLNDRERSTP